MPAERTRVRRGFLGISCVAAFLVGWVFLAPVVADRGTGLVELTATRSTIGQVVPVAGTSYRPAVQVSADRPVPAAQQDPRVAAPPGTRLVAVHFRLRNAGTRTWVSPPNTAFGAADSGTTPPGRILVHRLRAGPTYVERTRVPPGGAVEGFVVFALPRRAHLTEVSLQLSGIPGDVVIWSLR
jgi:hypothetical protein